MKTNRINKLLPLLLGSMMILTSMSDCEREKSRYEPVTLTLADTTYVSEYVEVEKDIIWNNIDVYLKDGDGFFFYIGRELHSSTANKSIWLHIWVNDRSALELNKKYRAIVRLHDINSIPYSGQVIFNGNNKGLSGTFEFIYDKENGIDQVANGSFQNLTIN